MRFDEGLLLAAPRHPGPGEGHDKLVIDAFSSIVGDLKYHSLFYSVLYQLKQY